MASTHLTGREKLKTKIRHTISGTADRPRISVFRSLKSTYAQAIDDVSRNTLVSVASDKKDGKKDKKSQSAFNAGVEIAEKLIKIGKKQVVFDRNGYRYHGRIKALAEGARKGGLEF